MLQASSGIYTHLNGAHGRILVGNYKIGAIAQQRKAHLTNSISEDELIHDRAWAKEQGLRAFAGYPLLVEDRLVGVMAMFSQKELTPATLQSMESTANGIALAIDHKQSEEKLRESEARLRLLVETMPQLAWTGEPDGSVDFFNQRWYEYTGAAAAQTLGHSWLEVVHPEDAPEFSNQWARARQTGEPLSIEHRLRANDGAYHWFVSQALPLHSPTGKIIKWIGTYTDIDQQKELERRKDEFIALASHELKTPITGLKMSTQLLGRRLLKEEAASADGTPSFTARQINRMDDQLNRLTELVNDLLDVSKIEAGKLDYRMEDLDSAALISDFVEDLRLVSEKHTINIGALASGHVIADKERIRQVFTNLVTNAIKYSPQADQVIVSSKIADEQLVVGVQDFGIGIPAADSEKIFDRFFQVHNHDDHGGSYPGLGLGLYISAQIVKRHGGNIWVESEHGHGSTFYFSLPLAPEETAATRSAGLEVETLAASSKQAVLLSKTACLLL